MGVFVIVALSSIAGGAMAWQQGWIAKITSQIINTPAPTVTPDETAGWKTYRNEKYGFEAKYPIGTLIDESKETDFPGIYQPRVVLSVPFPETNIYDKYKKSSGEIISVEMPIFGVRKNFEVSMITDISGAPPSQQTCSGDPVSINKINFAKQDVAGDYVANQTGAYVFQYCVIRNGIMFNILTKLGWSRFDMGNLRQGESLKNLRTDPFDPQKESKILDQILSTFKFVK